MEISVDSQREQAVPDARSLRLRLLGRMSLECNGAAVPLPASRKARALLAWLALAPRAVGRETLCDLLWDAPNDPRGELRWCLSRIRVLVDDQEVRRVRTEGEFVRLDLSGDFVDALEVERSLVEGIETLALQRVFMLASLFEGDFLDGLELAHAPPAEAWLSSQRRRFRMAQAALLARCAASETGAAALPHLERWLALEPFELHAHRAMLDALLSEGRLREAQAHFALAERLFADEGLDRGPLHSIWQRLRQGASPLLPPIDASVASTSPSTASTSQAIDRSQEATVSGETRRRSIAVLPFTQRGDGPAVHGGDARTAAGGIGVALAHDIVTRLAKLRGVFVIAQGSAAALHERGVGAAEAARLLNVDYVCSGTIGQQSQESPSPDQGSIDAARSMNARKGSMNARRGRASIDVELVETHSGRVVWTERFPLVDVFATLDDIGDRIVASLAAEIEALERNRAVLLPPDSLDAWSAHHRGLWHMYRFDAPDNATARRFFEMATELDPTFARAWAGLSFTHFQNAFQGWGERDPEIERAIDTAAQALMADVRDPSAHWAMGRALWLREGHDASVRELDQAIELSPNFALAHYTLAFVHAQAGDPHAAIAASDHARLLSPFDPLLFGMLGARAIAHVRLGELDEAALWAERAAARPNAHPHIHAIAAFAQALCGSLDAARRHAAVIRRTLPAYGFDDFAAAFRLDADAGARFREGARRIGM